MKKWNIKTMGQYLIVFLHLDSLMMTLSFPLWPLLLLSSCRVLVLLLKSLIHWSLDDDSVDVSGTTDSKG